MFGGVEEDLFAGSSASPWRKLEVAFAAHAQTGTGGVTSSSSRPEVLGWALPTLKALTSGWAGSSCLGLPLYDHFRPVILLFWVSVGCDGWLSTNCCCCCCNWEICFPPSAIAGVATASEGVLSEGQSLLWRPIPASFHLSHCHHRQTVSADGSANASKMSVSR
ncbi:hypothetical protein MLD38_022820 [Melastoma candidum]|uniref:Uncharacterized protein n=1 Tax=Melastoma candidum TaxID=119954 RepID=A0ACB9QJP8_9MYRT|nr:hypothetical protein MLD38_022820 [Melastoma candidum]